tara:strand:- start:267 stop:485 length:219 start_codon:yes stop_codon:yes gene_type:complete
MTKKNKIKIKLNGKFILVDRSLSIRSLIKKHKIPTKMVAIELNKNILEKSKFSKTILKDNDKVEIVHFIGGG